MQNTFKKFLLLNSLILAQFCFLTAQVNKSPEIISDSNESYTQKLQLDTSHDNLLANNIPEDNLKENLTDNDFSYFLFFLSLIIFSFLLTNESNDTKNNKCSFYKTEILLKNQYYNCWYKKQLNIYLIIKNLNNYFLSLFKLEKNTLEYI